MPDAPIKDQLVSDHAEQERVWGAGVKEVRDGALIILAPTLLFFIGAGLFGSSSSLVSSLGAGAMFAAFAFGALVGGFGLILIFGGVLRVTFEAVRRKHDE